MLICLKKSIKKEEEEEEDNDKNFNSELFKGIIDNEEKEINKRENEVVKEEKVVILKKHIKLIFIKLMMMIV